MPVLGRDASEEVEADRIIVVGGIEVDEIIRSPGRDVIEELLSMIAVRIDDTNATASSDILNDQIPQQRRFAAPGFPDRIEMLPAIAALQTEGLSSAPAESLPNVHHVIFVLVVHGFGASPYSRNNENAL